MSRKRKQNKGVAAPASVETESVPEEILAEGSGPVDQVDAADLAEAANAVGRRRKRRGTGQKPAMATGEASTGEEAADQSDEVSAGDESGTVNGHVVADDAAAGVADAEVEAVTADAAPDDVDAEAAEAEASAEDAAPRRGGRKGRQSAAAVADGIAEGGRRRRGRRGSAASAEPDGADADGEAGAAPAEAVGVEVDERAVEAETVMADADERAVEALGVDAEAAAGVEAEGAELEGAAVEAAPDGDELDDVTDDEASELGGVLPTSAASMDDEQLKYLVEALVFASDKPLTVQRLRQLTRVSDTKRLEQALAAITEDFSQRGIVLQQVSGGYQFRTRTQFSGWVQQLIAGRPVRLSSAQLETLAIIAYRQPITRPEIDDIRGVDSSATLKLLIDRSLIRILGKKEEVGRPMLYGTTKEFLDFFSLGDLRELPTLREYSELTDESRQVMRARLGLELDNSSLATGDSDVGSDGGDDGGGDGGDDGGSGGDGGGSNGSGGDGGGLGPNGFEPSDVEASASHVEAMEPEAAAVHTDAALEEDATSHVGADLEMDAVQAEGGTEGMADAAVVDGPEWPEGSGRVGDSPGSRIGPAVVLAPAAEVAEDGAEAMDSALVEQMAERLSDEHTPE